MVRPLEVDLKSRCEGEAAATDTPEKKGKWGDRVKAMKAKAEAARAKIAK